MRALIHHTDNFNPIQILSAIGFNHYPSGYYTGIQLPKSHIFMATTRPWLSTSNRPVQWNKCKCIYHYDKQHQLCLIALMPDYYHVKLKI